MTPTVPFRQVFNTADEIQRSFLSGKFHITLVFIRKPLAARLANSCHFIAVGGNFWLIPSKLISYHWKVRSDTKKKPTLQKLKPPDQTCVMTGLKPGKGFKQQGKKSQWHSPRDTLALVRIWMYIYIYTHTYTHIYTHTHIYTFVHFALRVTKQALCT